MSTALSSSLDFNLAPLFGIVLAGLLLALSWIDLRTFRLPNTLTFTLIGIGLLWSYLSGNFQAALIGCALGYASFVGIAALFKALRGIDGLGRGDAKLLAAGGSWVGWTGLPMIVLIASLLGIVLAVVMHFLPREETSAPANWIAFGPCLAVGIFAVWAASQLA